MFEFTCSTCGKRVQGDELLSGKRVHCPVCNAAMTAPTTGIATLGHAGQTKLPSAPSDSAFAEGLPPLAERPFPPIRKEGPAILMRWMPLMIVTVIVLTGVALLLPATVSLRDSSVRTQSVSNLRGIACAWHSFYDAHKRPPFNGSNIEVDQVRYSALAIGNTGTSGSWAFQILPFIDQNTMFAELHRNTAIMIFMCPGRGRPPVESTNGGGAWTDYFYNNYLNNPLQAAKPDSADMRRTLVGITDGTSNTILVGHGNISVNQYQSTANVTLSTNIFMGGTPGTMRSGNNGNSSPTGVTLQRDSAIAPGIGSWGGPFPRGALMAMADATVRMFPYGMNNFSDFLTPTGNEAVILPDS